MVHPSTSYPLTSPRPNNPVADEPPVSWGLLLATTRITMCAHMRDPFFYVRQTYQRFLQQNAILSQDTIHNLFLNLNSIVDFARRFLIGVEGNASLPPEQQRFGSLFVLMVSETW